MSNVEEKSTVCKVLRERYQMAYYQGCEYLKRTYQEDHLGVALIRSGDSVIIKMRYSMFLHGIMRWNRE